MKEILNRIKDIKLSLLKKYKEDEFDTITSGNFKMENMQQSEEFYAILINAIYDNLNKITQKQYDHVGLWITFNDDTIISNAITTSDLNAMEEYSHDEIDSMWEFFKMTINQ